MKFKDIFYYSTLFAIICMIFYLIYSNVALKEKIQVDSIELKSLKKKFDTQKKYEGKFIWKMLGISKNYYLNFIKQKKINNEYIFLIVNKIDCFSCFNFHITELNKVKITKIFYSPNNYELVRRHLNNCIKFSKISLSPKKGLLLKENIAIAFINKQGKIVYVDVADKTNYQKSKVFYKIIDRFAVKYTYVNANSAKM